MNDTPEQVTVVRAEDLVSFFEGIEIIPDWMLSTAELVDEAARTGLCDEFGNWIYE